MKTISTALLTMEKTTPGAVMYKNVKVGVGQAITNLYLRKDGLTEPFPGSITVTVSVEDGEGE